MPELKHHVERASTHTYTTEDRLYVTQDGRVLLEDELNENTPASLLAPAGGLISEADARKYGLIEGEAPGGEQPVPSTVAADAGEPAEAPVDIEAKALDGPPATKARRAAPETK